MTYGPIVGGSRTELFLARQWDERSPDIERDFAAVPGVAGFVFGSFRHDNPDAVRRGDWRAGRVS
jgi:hypothetical protein